MNGFIGYNRVRGVKRTFNHRIVPGGDKGSLCGFNSAYNQNVEWVLCPTTRPAPRYELGAGLFLCTSVQGRMADGMSKEPFNRSEYSDQKRPFTGWFISVDVVHLFDARTINLKEAILLAVIYNYSKTEKGCFMSNGRLGRELGVTGNHASSMISHLKSLKLISETGFDGRSRQLRVLDFRKAESRKTRRQPTEKSGGRVPKNRDHKYKEESKGKRGGKTTTPRSGLLTEEWDNMAAARLRSILVNNDADLVTRLNTRFSTFTKQISRLRLEGKVSKDEIKTVLTWLKDHYSDGFTPKIYKVTDLFNNWGRFRDARFRWMEDNGMNDSNSNGSVDVRDIFNQIQIMGCSLDYDQEDIDDAAVLLGAAAGTFTMEDMPE